MPRLRAADAASRKESGRSKDFLEVLSRGFRVIDAMDDGNKALTLSDIARATDLPKPSVGRILYTLCDLGYTEQVGRTYRLTPKVLRLATAYLGSSGNTRLLQRACDDLSTETGQSALVGVLEDHDVLVVAYSMPQELLAPRRGVGARLPAYCTAGGRILLGGLPDHQLDAFLAGLELTPQTDFTITDKSLLRENIVATRRNRFCTADDEYLLGWHSMAFPLNRYDGTLFGALSLNCKKSSVLSASRMAELKEIAERKVREIEPMLI